MVVSFKTNDGKQIPAIAWGNGTGGLSNSGQTAVDLGVIALEGGFTHIDTAQGYGTESETREALAKSGKKREDVWITTKLSPRIDGKPNFEPGFDLKRDLKTTHEDIKASVKSSLDKLGGRPDLLLIHTPYVPEKGKIGEFWTILEDLVHDGTLEGVSLGISNFQPEMIEEVLAVAKIKPVAHQLEFHPYLLAQLQPILDTHAKHGIITEAYGPLTPILRHSGGPLKPVLAKLAKAHGVDEGSVLLAWTIQKGVVAVTSSKNEQRLKSFTKVYDLTLDDSEIEEIDNAGRSIHFRHYDEHMSNGFAKPDLPDGK